MCLQHVQVVPWGWAGNEESPLHLMMTWRGSESQQPLRAADSLVFTPGRGHALLQTGEQQWLLAPHPNQPLLAIRARGRVAATVSPLPPFAVLESQ